MKKFFSSLLDSIFGKKETKEEVVSSPSEKVPEDPKIELPTIEEKKESSPSLEPPKKEVPPASKPVATPQNPTKPSPAKSTPTRPAPSKPIPAKQGSAKSSPPPAKLPTPPKPLSTKINFVNPNFSRLSNEDFKKAADFLDCEEAIVRAVVEVESSGGGFLPSNRPKILFEAHLFARHTKNAHNKTNPGVSSQTWNRTLYKGGEKEYERLEEALKLNEEAALASCSYGMFQILASNFKSCGFGSVEDFVKAQISGEKEQLESFLKFIKANKLEITLQALNFPLFAKRYNGPSYRSNKYDIKLQNSYEKWKQKLNK